MNIIVLYNNQQNATWYYLLNEMSSAFSQLGHNASILPIDLQNSSPVNETFVKTFSQKIDFAFSFNAYYMDFCITDSKKTFNIFNYFNIPFITMLLDSPSHDSIVKKLAISIDQLIVTFADKASLRILPAVFPPTKFKLSSFLPQGGTMPNSVMEESWEAYQKNRTIPLLFVGQVYENGYFYSKPMLEQLCNDWNHSPKMAKLVVDIIHCILEDSRVISIEEAFYYVTGLKLSEFTSEEQKSFYLNCSFYIEICVRAQRRYKFLEAVGKAGLPLHLYGDGWERYLSKYKSITFHGDSTYNETLSYMQKTNISINTTGLVYGASERCFNAMLSGAVAAEPFNEYFSDNGFTDGQDIILYNWHKLDDVMNKMALLLKNPEAMRQIALAAKAKAEAGHSWLNRAQEILKLFAMYKNSGNL